MIPIFMLEYAYTNKKGGKNSVLNIYIMSKQKNTQIEEESKALLDTIYVIGGKWKLPIIFSICSGGNKRFRDIQRSIPGITTRMLSRNLRELEENQLITRTVYPDSPVLVEYEITEYIKEYGLLIHEMIEWGKKHRNIITGKR